MEHLIPEIWFTEQASATLVVIAIVAMALLIKGADWLVEGASGAAYRMGISKVIVGATIVSLGTTSPECAVSVMAAWRGDAGLALGNAVGSIIADTGLIFGLGCVMVVLPADRFVLSRQGWAQFGSAALLALICLGAWLMQGDAAVLGRSVGVLLIALLAFYMWISVRWSRQHRTGEPYQMDDDADVAEKTHTSWLKLITQGVVGLALVLVFSDITVKCVVELAHRMHVPTVVIASTIVAFGTSLPELVIGMTAIRKGQRELLVGNVIGADILNVLFVVGMSAFAADLPIVDGTAPVPRVFLYLHLPAMMLILVVFRLAVFSATRKGHFTRWHGAPLLVIYVAYLAMNYWMSIPR